MNCTLSKKKIKREVRDYVRCRFERIVVDPGDGVFNFRCFDNAVQKALNRDDAEVYEVFYIENLKVVLHYVNYYPEVKAFVDNTLGFKAKNFEYYLIRKIPDIDYDTLEGEFGRSVEYWTNKFSNKFQRFFLKFNRLV